MTVSTFNMGVSNDCGYSRLYNGVSKSFAVGSDMFIGNSPSDDDDAAQLFRSYVRFPLSGVSQGDTINSATLTLTYASSYVASAASDMDVWGNDADTPVIPTDYDDMLAKTKTTATLFRSPSWTSSGDTETFDVTAIVQEVVNRPLWDGSAVMFLLFPNGTISSNASVPRTRYENNLSASTEPELEIDFASGGGGGGGGSNPPLDYFNNNSRRFGVLEV